MSWKLTWNVLKMSWKVHKGLYLFYYLIWIEFEFENVKYISICLTNILKKYIKKKCLGGNNLTWKFHDNFQVKLFPPKNMFLIFFFKYSLNNVFNIFKFELNPLDNKKGIGLYVLFRTFHDNFQVKLFPPKNIFFNIFFNYLARYWGREADSSEVCRLPYTNVLKIYLKCPEKYTKACIFFYYPMDWVQIWKC
jgi:hypothetical protein